MKIATVLGARPQFIKSAPVSASIASNGHQELIIHTGQHYDYQMSDVFFNELNIPKPHINLSVGSGTHGRQTGKILIDIEKIFIKESPDFILVYGDTNSTIAGALAGAKLNIPVAHVEAGLRSFNKEMPEEHNRILTDHCSNLLFCPTQTAMSNLKKENLQINAHWVGDTMYDAVLQHMTIAEKKSNILKRLFIEPQEYLLATIHRPYNTDDPYNLQIILNSFQELNTEVILPIHPRALKMVINMTGKDYKKIYPNINFIDPVGYLDMLILEKNSKLILTDSGGIQKEAYFMNIPCITLRPETEWVETIKSGWNTLVNIDKDEIISTIESFTTPPYPTPQIFGDGSASQKIVLLLEENR